MLSSWRKKFAPIHKAVSSSFEPLENRRLLSGGPWGFGGHHGAFGGFGGPGPGFGGGFGGRGGDTIAFSLAPSDVQAGLTKLASTDNLPAPTSTQLVTLGNSNGVETYSIIETGTGTVSRLTVDQLGDAVTAPTQTTTTWATLSGTGTGSDSAAATEITTIATALSLTAPASTDTVNVTTTSTGAVTYSIHLNSNTSSATPVTAWGWGGNWGNNFGQDVTVDSAGNPAGNQQLPFSVFSSTIQAGLNALAPTGATALASTSTQNVNVQTVDGIVTYTTTFTVSGTVSKVTVGTDGKAISLPATTTTTFSALTSTVQTELQTLATADGVTGTIAANQSINVLTETNGTVIYSATLSESHTSSSGDTYNIYVTVSSDANGNPTVPPRGGHSAGHFGFGFSGNGGDCNPGDSGDNSNASNGSTNSSNASSVTIAPPASGTTTASTANASAANSIAGTYSVTGKLLSNATTGFGIGGGYFLEFAPAGVSSTVQTDLTNLQSAQKTLATDIKALSKTQKVTLVKDEKAIAAAIKAISSTLAPLESTLKTDAKTWAKTIGKDLLAVFKDRKNATELAAAKSQLTSDEDSAFAAIVTDQGAIASAINANSGVITAQNQLATDLPTIGSDQATIRSDQAQLVADV
jgi:hypothetical protein